MSKWYEKEDSDLPLFIILRLSWAPVCSKSSPGLGAHISEKPAVKQERLQRPWFPLTASCTCLQRAPGLLPQSHCWGQAGPCAASPGPAVIPRPVFFLASCPLTNSALCQDLWVSALYPAVMWLLLPHTHQNLLDTVFHWDVSLVSHSCLHSGGWVGQLRSRLGEQR